MVKCLFSLSRSFSLRSLRSLRFKLFVFLLCGLILFLFLGGWIALLSLRQDPRLLQQPRFQSFVYRLSPVQPTGRTEGPAGDYFRWRDFWRYVHAAKEKGPSV